MSPGSIKAKGKCANPSLEPIKAQTSVAGSRVTLKRFLYQFATAWRKENSPLEVGYWPASGLSKTSCILSKICFGVGRSGSPMPKSITSTPSFNNWAFFSSILTNRYGGILSKRCDFFIAHIFLQKQFLPDLASIPCYLHPIQCPACHQGGEPRLGVWFFRSLRRQLHKHKHRYRKPWFPRLRVPRPQPQSLCRLRL